MQWDLFGASEFVPIAHGTRHYVPVLQNKPGELTALETASPDTWDRLTPLIHVVGPKTPPRGGVSVEAVRSWMKRISDAVKGHPCFLDIARLKPGALTRARASKPGSRTRGATGQRLVLDCIYEASRKRQINFVPVFPVGSSNETHLRLVRESVIQDGRGIALRYPLQGTVPIGTPTDLLLRTLSDVGEGAENTDLLLDFSWLSPDTDLDLELTGALIDQLVSVGEWRSVVFLGTSMPSSLSCVTEGTLGSLPRDEWQLWNSLVSANGSRRVTYGDYAIQHPRPPQETGPGMRANIRYTTDSQTLVARGNGAVFIEGKEQYRRLCRQIISRPEYLGERYSWGDFQIQECADDTLDPGSQNLWRAAGTSHHLRFVTQQLASREEREISE